MNTSGIQPSSRTSLNHSTLSTTTPSSVSIPAAESSSSFTSKSSTIETTQIHESKNIKDSQKQSLSLLTRFIQFLYLFYTMLAFLRSDKKQQQQQPPTNVTPSRPTPQPPATSPERNDEDEMLFYYHQPTLIATPTTTSSSSSSSSTTGTLFSSSWGIGTSLVSEAPHKQQQQQQSLSTTNGSGSSGTTGGGHHVLSNSGGGVMGGVGTATTASSLIASTGTGSYSDVHLQTPVGKQILVPHHHHLQQQNNSSISNSTSSTPTSSTTSSTVPTMKSSSSSGGGRESLLASQFIHSYQGEKEFEYNNNTTSVLESSTFTTNSMTSSPSAEQGIRYSGETEVATMGLRMSGGVMIGDQHLIQSHSYPSTPSHHHQLVMSGGSSGEASKHPYDFSEVHRRLSEIEPSTDESKNTLVIKNLPFKFKQADLDKILSDNNARPKNVRLLRDDAGRFTGIAFVRCPSKDEAAKLILSMNNMDVGGRAIQVEFKKKKSKKKQIQQQQQKGLSSSGHSLLSSSGDSDRLSLSSDDELLASSSTSHHAALQPMMNQYNNYSARRLAFSDEISQTSYQPQATAPSTGAPASILAQQSMYSAPQYQQQPQQSEQVPMYHPPQHQPQQQQQQQQPQSGGKRLSFSAEHTFTEKHLRKPIGQPTNSSSTGFSLQQSQQHSNQSFFSTPFPLAQQQQQQQQQQPGLRSSYSQQGYGQQSQSYQQQQRQQQQQQQVYQSQQSLFQHQIQPPPGLSRRKSMSQVEGSALYPRSMARPLSNSAENEFKSASIRPTRQPIGPDGKSKGFSAEYQQSRSNSLSSSQGVSRLSNRWIQ